MHSGVVGGVSGGVALGAATVHYSLVAAGATAGTDLVSNSVTIIAAVIGAVALLIAPRLTRSRGPDQWILDAIAAKDDEIEDVQRQNALLRSRNERLEQAMIDNHLVPPA